MFRHSYCNLLNMKRLLSLLFFSLIIVSCSSVKVITDFDSSANFSNYTSFAFSKSQIKFAISGDLAPQFGFHAFELHIMFAKVLPRLRPSSTTEFDVDGKAFKSLPEVQIEPRRLKSIILTRGFGGRYGAFLIWVD